MPFLDSITGRIRRAWWIQWTFRAAGGNKFLFLLPVVGVLVGFATVGTAHLISFLQNLFWGDGQNLLTAAQGNPWPLRIIIPLTGGLIVGAIGWAFHVNTRGGGIVTIIQAVALKGGHLSLRQTLPRDIAAVFTLATGGALGREGAMARLASAIGSHLGEWAKLTPQQHRTLVCAAAGGALAAVYNAPIGGALFALEVIIGSFALEVLGPVIVVSVISTLVFRMSMGNLPRFEVPRYELVSSWELFSFLGLGLLAGIVSWLFVKMLFTGQDIFEKLPLPRWLKPAIGMALLGVIGVYIPHVFGNGFEAVNLALRTQVPVLLLLLVLGAKMLASTLSFGSGAAGGLFTPSLMVGALLGGTYGLGVHHLFPQHTAESGVYAMVAMGGVLAGMTHAPLTAIMMIFEQTNSYQLILPIMFVCVISHFTVRLLKGKSMEQEGLTRRGVVLPQGPEGSVMQTLSVGDVMHDDVHSIPQTAPFPVIVEQFLKEPYNNLYVTGPDDRFLGAIRLHSLKTMLHDAEHLKTVIAADLADESFAVVTPHHHLADTMDIFWQQDTERLPVVNNIHDRKLTGWISKRDLLGVYSQEILRKRQLLVHFSTGMEDDKRDAFVELPENFELRTVAVPVEFTGNTLAALAPRSGYGVHVIAIKRRDALTGRDTTEMPDPQLQFRTGDRLIVIGQFDGIAQFMAALATGPAGFKATCS